MFFAISGFEAVSQNQYKNINNLLYRIGKTNNSKLIAEHFTDEIASLNKKDFQELALFFKDTSLTDVYSDCQNRKLKRGELAIIVADLADNMPYHNLTGIQNCILSFCKNNPNLIEYYFNYMEDKNYDTFCKKYNEYINSKEFVEHELFTYYSQIEKARKKLHRKNKK